MPFSPEKRWTLGAKALTEKLTKEFHEELQKATEAFVEMENRQIVDEADLKVALIDTFRKMADQRIILPSARFTQKELIESIRVLKKQMEARQQKGA